MRMIIESNDIYDVQINDIITGKAASGCSEGYDDFKVDVDDVTQDDDGIEIEISGTCACFGYHNSLPCTFEGTLTMDESDFTDEYTNAAEDGDKYIEFSGNIEISFKSGQGIDLNVDEIVEDTFKDTMHNILYEIEQEVDDGYSILEKVAEFIIVRAADKVVEEIKRIDNVDIDKDNKNKYVDYVLENILNDSYSITNAKYKSIDTILNNQATEDIKNDKIASLIDDELDERSEYEEQEITAKVFFADLDP